MEISVVVTNYNYGGFLPRCVRSLISQSYNRDEYEIIVIDDASTDDSKQIINGYQQAITPIFNEKNLGLAASCNKAIHAALGKHIVRVDADDYVHHDFLKLHHLFLANNKDMDATSSDYYEVDMKENILRRKNGITWPVACGVMYKIDDLIDIGLYDETLPREDVDLRQRFLKKYQVYNIPVPLYRYTMHSESMTKNIQL